MLSRKVVEVQWESLIIDMPGSSKSARKSLEALFPRMLYALPTMTGGGHGKKKGMQDKGNGSDAG